MDFGDILDAWEKQTAIPQGDRKRRKLKAAHKEEMEKRGAVDGEKKKKTDASSDEKPRRQPRQQLSRSSLPHDELAVWLETHEIYDKDADTEVVYSAAENRARLLRKRPDAVIDLHNLTQDKAWKALEDFFQECLAQKLEKVLIIHGKGNHSNGGEVLKHLVQKFIEKNPCADESGYNPAKTGGSGATWVILKR
ncbi:MAG: Smr/MutS family protein [Treponema sp.]|jgi:DNA-nicking Smr family endonuclease|nr:Smr/MutS family protein [Treponema sp.]